MASFKQTIAEYHPKNRKALRTWLSKNHDKSPGVWLVLNKKGSGEEVIGWDAVVEECLCFGWVDSVPNKINDTRYKLMITPRKPKSVWSQINKARIEQLIADGQMTEHGLVKIEQAKANGSWDALNEADSLQLPADLQAAFKRNAQARKNFDAFSESSRKQILWYILSAKRPETRVKRIAETVTLAAQGLRANHPQDLKKK